MIQSATNTVILAHLSQFISSYVSSHTLISVRVSYGCNALLDWWTWWWSCAVHAKESVPILVEFYHQFHPYWSGMLWILNYMLYMCHLNFWHWDYCTNKLVSTEVFQISCEWCTMLYQLWKWLVVTSMLHNVFISSKWQCNFCVVWLVLFEMPWALICCLTCTDIHPFKNSKFRSAVWAGDLYRMDLMNVTKLLAPHEGFHVVMPSVALLESVEFRSGVQFQLNVISVDSVANHPHPVSHAVWSNSAH